MTPAMARGKRRAQGTRAKRKQLNVIGYPFKAKWQPKQNKINIAKRLIDRLQTELPQQVILRDPVGNEFHISVVIKSNRPCFTDGLREIRAFYQIRYPVYLWYKYMGNGIFRFRIWKPLGLGQIQFPIPNDVNGDGKQNNEPNDLNNESQNVPHNPCDDMAVPGITLWKTQVTQEEFKGPYGLVVPGRVINSYLHDRPKHIVVRLPNLQVQTWELTWNRQIWTYCRIVRPWFRLCKDEQIKPGDLLRFWKLEGEYSIRIVLTRMNA